MRLFQALIIAVGLCIPTVGFTPQPVLPAARIKATQDDILCLAKNIYHEARSETLLGQLAVAQVTVNRALHPRFRDTLCGVVYSPHQFSWTSKPKRVRDPKAWQQALDIARGVVSGTLWIPGFTATHYHTTKVNPRWNRKLRQLAIIGQHIFYD